MITALTMLAIFAVFVGVALGYSPEARMAPLVVALPGLFFSLVQVGRELRARRKTAPHEDGRPSMARQLKMVAWLGGFTLMILLAGFLLGGSAMVMAYSRFDQKEPVSRAVLMGGACFLLLFGVFEQMLGLVLYRGWIPLTV